MFGRNRFYFDSGTATSINSRNLESQVAAFLETPTNIGGTSITFATKTNSNIIRDSSGNAVTVTCSATLARTLNCPAAQLLPLARNDSSWLVIDVAPTAGDTDLAGSITAVAITFDVDDASGFAVGDVIKCGTEYMLINAISTNTLTVTRGVGYDGKTNGSTAATHADEAATKKVFIIDLWTLGV